MIAQHHFIATKTSIVLTQCITVTSIKTEHCRVLYWSGIIFCACSSNGVHLLDLSVMNETHVTSTDVTVTFY